MSADPYDLERFVVAQDSHGAYVDAVAELSRGRKASHWMWFVFPQIGGLGHSKMARHFAISSLAEAMAYLNHPVLGPRLIECTRLLDETESADAVDILGTIDAQKLRSSMTLFMRADPDAPLFQRVLDRYFDGVADLATDRVLAAG